jgi:hypothetical protein
MSGIVGVYALMLVAIRRGYLIQKPKIPDEDVRLGQSDCQGAM